MGAVGYTQTSPQKNNQFVNQKKKFFANNQHHKQNEFIFGSPVQQRGGYGNESVSTLGFGVPYNSGVVNVGGRRRRECQET